MQLNYQPVDRRYHYAGIVILSDGPVIAGEQDRCRGNARLTEIILAGKRDWQFLPVLHCDVMKLRSRTVIAGEKSSTRNHLSQISPHRTV